MSAWAKPGVKCVCIKNSIAAVNYKGFPGFLKGQTFTIAEVIDYGAYGLALRFVERHAQNLGAIDGFRPLVTRTQELDLALFTPLLETTKELV